MPQVQGTVSRVENGQAIVEIVRSSGCGRCHEPGGCGGVDISAGCRNSYVLPNTIDARPGDQVLVVVAEGSVLRAVALAYGLPGAGLVAGTVLAKLFAASDLVAFGGALAGLAAGFLLLRRLAKGSDPGREARALSIHPCHH